MHSAAPDRTDLVAWLRGRWAVTRTINDTSGHFTGTAEFTPGEDGVTRWHETGDLTLGTHTGPARRTLLMQRDGDVYAVRFDDWRPFHELDLRGDAWQATHLCGADTYRGAFAVGGDDRFTVTWHVTGPGRDDTIVSEYRREQSAA